MEVIDVKLKGLLLFVVILLATTSFSSDLLKGYFYDAGPVVGIEYLTATQKGLTNVDG